jgi:flagellar M-ring protein FliF
VGFNQQRGDVVEVINMQFALPEPVEEPPPPFLGLSKQDYLKVGEFLVFLVVALLVILLVVRPIISRSFRMASQAEGEAVGVAAEGVGEVSQEQRLAIEAQQKRQEEEESMMDMAQVEGRVKASTVKKIGDIVDKHPDEALSIIRSWLYQEA